MGEKIVKSDEEWRKQLTLEQYRVTRQKGTERAFTGELMAVHARGELNRFYFLVDRGWGRAEAVEWFDIRDVGRAAARLFGITGVRFVETDLHHAGLKPDSFDVVYSAGVLHHTADPAAAFACVVRLARPGGIVVVGVYNAVARLPLRFRRGIARLTGFRIVPFDPILRERREEPARRLAWLRDQYQHPEEHRYPIAEVKRWFADNHV